MTNLHDAVIDSRDIIKRIEELESTQADLVERLSNGEISESDMKAFDDEEGKELDMLREFAAEASQYSSDWEYGETLIHEDYFVEYCMEILKDCGELPTNIPWYIVIDEEATAENLKPDYVKLELDGQTYYMRAS